MKVLNLTLYRIYFDQIQRGIKNTEYRDMSDYWVGKLIDTTKYNIKDIAELKNKLINGEVKPVFVPYTHVRFKNGNNFMLVKIKEIVIYRGHTIFAIKLGDIVKE